MLAVKKISDNVWKFTGTDLVNFYFIDFGKEKIVIDAGNRTDRSEIKMLFGNLANFNKISKVIFTHLHYDHIGNFDLFKNACFFASEQEITDLKNDKKTTILNEDLALKFNVKLNPVQEKIGPLEIIKTPGHTRGSICIWYPEKKILFTGDTLFFNKQTGRTDLPNSSPSEMSKSLINLLNYNFKILAPGHDY